MPDRRAILAALMLIGVCLAPPAAADERQAAQNRLTVAKRSVALLQAKAEHAIEVHNGTLVVTRRAALVRKAAAARADAARFALNAATTAADEATRQARTASDLATATAGQSEQAERDAVGAQQRLDRLASGAYRGVGRMGVLAQLMTADDPLELVTGHLLMNAVADDQHRVIVELDVAHQDAERAAETADTAKGRALTAAQHATVAVAATVRARSAADAANHEAALTAQAAQRALATSHRAKGRAAAAVARAEAVLHRAARTVESLERAARQARRVASRVESGRPPSDAAKTAIRAAFDQIGVPYSWGGGDESGPTYGFAQGAGTRGFDCSGLTLYAYAQAGIRLDHYSGSQWNQGKRISSRRDVLPGDLLFFAYKADDPSTIHHVGLYLGDNRMIEAPYTGEVVRVGSANRDDFIGATRPWA